MDQLMLQSVYSKVRNPRGFRRWGYHAQEIDPTVTSFTAIHRVKQVLATGAPIARDNAPFFLFEIPANPVTPGIRSDFVMAITTHDLWERPAKRWGDVDISVVGGKKQVLSFFGQPFVVTDPIVSSVKYAANRGDDILLVDKITGDRFMMKIAAVDVPAGNKVFIEPPQGGTLPPDSLTTVHEYRAYHTIDAFQILCTVTHTIRDTDDAQWIKPLLRLTYYRDGQTPIDEEYEAMLINQLGGGAIFTEPVLKPDGTATGFKQAYSLFQIPLARVPDEAAIVFRNVKQVVSTNGPVQLGNVSLWQGDHTNLLIDIVSNVLTVSPAFPPAPAIFPAPDSLYATPAVVDIADYFTGAGEIVMVPAGSTCPPGYENVAQIQSTINPLYLQDPGTGALDAIWAPTWTAVYVSGTNKTQFTSQAIPTGNPFRTSRSNSATWQIVWSDSGVLTALRMPQMVVNNTTGVITFDVDGDYSFRSGQVGRVLINGVIRKGALANAGTYLKPSLEGTDAVVGEGDSGSSTLERDVIQIDQELFDVVGLGDILTFTDEDGTPLPAVPVTTPSAGNTGPAYEVVGKLDGTQAGNNGAVGLKVLDVVSGNVTNVSVFTSDAQDSFVSISNYFEIEVVETAHTHAVYESEDVSPKYRENGGHSKTHEDHAHDIPRQAVAPPYRQYLLCAKL